MSRLVNLQYVPRMGLAVLMLASAAGCATFPGESSEAGVLKSVSARPAWVESPGEGASASAGWNPKGRAAQEELATARARAEFARRSGVSVEGFTQNIVTESGSRVVTYGATGVQETVSQSNVSAVVREKWLDPDSDTMWVWVVPAGK